jgi:universal stress protein E
MNKTMPVHGRVLVVVDPASKGGLLALERAITTNEAISKTAYGKPLTLRVLLAVDSDSVDTGADNPDILRDGTWIQEHVVKPLADRGFPFKVQLSWSTDWYGIILRAESDKPVDSIMLPLASKPHERGRLFNESVWRLMRTAKAPVLFAQPNSAPQRKVLLAALNIQSHKPEHQKLNEATLVRAKGMASIYGADLHVVNAYEDSLNYPDRSQLVAMTGLDSSKIHVAAGEPDEVIRSVAKQIDADLLILGTRPRTNRWRGTTAERIITRLDCDIMTTPGLE